VPLATLPGSNCPDRLMYRRGSRIF
jgi:hypothetical protein